MAKLLIMIMPLMVVSMSFVTWMSIHALRNSTQAALEGSMEQTAGAAAERVADYLKYKQSLATALGSQIGALYGNELKASHNSAEADALAKKIKTLSGSNGFLDIYVTDASGRLIYAGNKGLAAEKEKILEAAALAKQNGYISEISPGTGTTNGEYVFLNAAPIKAPSGKTVGTVICVNKASEISDLVSNIRVGKDGSTFILDGKGDCVAHRDPAMLYGGETFKAVQNKPEYASLKGLFTDMKEHDSGYMKYQYEGPRLAAFTTVSGTRNWALAVTASEKEFLAQANRSAIYAVAAAVLIMLVCTIIIVTVLLKISRRIRAVTGRLETLAQGDLSSDVLVTKDTDEVGRLSQAAKKLQDELSQIIGSLEKALEKIAAGNLTTEETENLPGDFAEINRAIERNKRRLSEVMRSISRTADEVARGSSQMAAGAADLAQGASEQSSSVEELFATVTELTEKARQIDGEEKKSFARESGEEKLDAEATEEAPKLAGSVSQQLKAAMERIDETSGTIRKIAADIDAISSETGMLALNASVEATHAGEFGRGFAVIAREIRGLSEKSREAARATDRKIDNIAKAVSRGNETVGYAISSVKEITTAISQIKAALGEISNVIENMAATAEETAAGSEELSAQADVLREMVSGFKFSKDEKDEREDNNE